MIISSSDKAGTEMTTSRKTKAPGRHSLHEGQIDAVYIALPNNMHCDYATRAAKAWMLTKS